MKDRYKLQAASKSMAGEAHDRTRLSRRYSQI
jgi:hypothetical protein